MGVWSDPYQGLAANIERYRNSPVMGSTVHEMYKPLLIVDGKVLPFPAPTKKLNPPRVRRSSQYSQIRSSIEGNSIELLDACELSPQATIPSRRAVLWPVYGSLFMVFFFR